MARQLFYANHKFVAFAAAAATVCLLLSAGCSTTRRVDQPLAGPTPVLDAGQRPPAQFVSQRVLSDHQRVLAQEVIEQRPVDARQPVESLQQLESAAQSLNPGLLGLQQRVAAAQARANYVGRLPDPVLGTNVFTNPIETAAGSQRANLTAMQMFPSLQRLDAQAQKAWLEAMALQQSYEAMRLKVVADVRVAWYRLYVLQKQIETLRANQQFLKLLINAANAVVAAGKATEADVKLGIVEYSRLEERVLQLRQRVVATKAGLNRAVGRRPDTRIETPTALIVALPDWSPRRLGQLARQRQPEILAAQIETQAALWGLEIAHLKRRPDIKLSASWYAIDDNRPSPSVVAVGRDAWSIGAQVSLPIGNAKYSAMEREAQWKHASSQAVVEEIVQRYDAMLVELWETAKTARATEQLYERTILPQARDALSSDQKSYALVAVEFDRVIRDFRSVLMLELGFHRARGDLAMALARIRQAVGSDLNNLAPADPFHQSRAAGR